MVMMTMNLLLMKIGTGGDGYTRNRVGKERIK